MTTISLASALLWGLHIALFSKGGHKLFYEDERKCFLLTYFSIKIFLHKFFFKTMIVYFLKYLPHIALKKTQALLAYFFLLTSTSEKQNYTRKQRDSSHLVQIQAINLTKKVESRFYLPLR